MIRYKESLTLTWPFHIALLILLPMGFGMIAPLSIVGGFISAGVFYLTALAIFVVRAPRIVVTDTTLRAGRATIDRSFLGDVRTVTESERPAAISDARTWKLLRAWIPTGVLVVINDPADPTPSWYLTTRHPEKLSAALKNL
jgi:hypothetical protein